jgi:predicted RNase H-like nuclease (RuvC/YqgF family)
MSEPMRFSLKHHGQLSCVEHCPEGEYVLHSDYAKLKAEVERLKAEPDALTAYLYADTLRRDDIKTLKAHIERLTKAVMHSPAAQLKLKELEGKNTYEEINPDNQ